MINIPLVPHWPKHTRRAIDATCARQLILPASDLQIRELIKAWIRKPGDYIEAVRRNAADIFEAATGGQGAKLAGYRTVAEKTLRRLEVVVDELDGLLKVLKPRVENGEPGRQFSVWTWISVITAAVLACTGLWMSYEIIRTMWVLSDVINFGDTPEDKERADLICSLIPAMVLLLAGLIDRAASRLGPRAESRYVGTVWALGLACGFLWIALTASTVGEQALGGPVTASSFSLNGNAVVAAAASSGHPILLLFVSALGELLISGGLLLYIRQTVREHAGDAENNDFRKAEGRRREADHIESLILGSRVNLDGAQAAHDAKCTSFQDHVEALYRQACARRDGIGHADDFLNNAPPWGQSDDDTTSPDGDVEGPRAAS